MSLVNNWMGDHLGSIHFVFFQFGRNIRQISQICPILLISLNFGKNSNNAKGHKDDSKQKCTQFLELNYPVK